MPLQPRHRQSRPQPSWRRAWRMRAQLLFRRRQSARSSLQPRSAPRRQPQSCRCRLCALHIMWLIRSTSFVSLL